jgi:PncC family amidohydrolase
VEYEVAIGELLTRSNLTVATAESLTGGLVGQLITSVPGASSYYRGGVIAYATDTKQSVLGVDGGLLAKEGPVSAAVARAMASGATRLLSASVGIATTGVAGPTEQDGHPVGTLFVGLADAHGTRVTRLHGQPGSRNDLRMWAAQEAMKFLVTYLQDC